MKICIGVNRTLFNRTGRELVMSVMMHILILAAVIVFGHAVDRSREAVVVYLTDGLPGGRSGSPSGSPGRSGAGSNDPVKQQRPEAKRTAGKESSSVRPQPTLTGNKELDPAAGSSLHAGTGAGGTEGVAGAGTGGSGSGGTGGTGTGTGRGIGSGSSPAGDVRARYLKEHFAYIRDLIMRHLVYPAAAKRKGFAGRVIVSFIIGENGFVERTQIIKSSGYDILDNSAMKTITEVQPFPKPPVRAELILPIVYRLD